MIRLLLLIPFLVACTSTPQGKAIDRHNYVDMGSTVYGIEELGGVEGNPLGWALVPAKWGMGWYVEEHYNCYYTKQFAEITGPFYAGFAVCNNLTIGTGMSLAFGAVCGVGYSFAQPYVEPSTMDCSHEPTLEQQLVFNEFRLAWEREDVRLLASTLAEDVVYSRGYDDEVQGKENVLAMYQHFFGMADTQRMKITSTDWINDPAVLGTAELVAWGQGFPSGEWYYEIWYNEHDKISHLWWWVEQPELAGNN